MIGGSASSTVGSAVNPRFTGPAIAGELTILVECNRKRCAGSWVLRPGQEIPPSCPRCGRFDW